MKKTKFLLIFLIVSFFIHYRNVFANNYPLFIKEHIKIENKDKIVKWVNTNNTKEFETFYFKDIDNLYDLKNKSHLKYQTQKDNLLYLIEIQANFFNELFKTFDNLNSEYLNFLEPNKDVGMLVTFLLWFHHLNNIDTISNDELKNYRKVCKQLQEVKIVSNFIMGLAITLPSLAKKVEYSPKIYILKVKKYTYQLGVYISYFNNSSNYVNLNIVNEFVLYDGFRTYDLDNKAMVKDSAIVGDLLLPNSYIEGELIFYGIIHYKYNYVMSYKPLMLDNYYLYQIFDTDSVKFFADFKLNF